MSKIQNAIDCIQKFAIDMLEVENKLNKDSKQLAAELLNLAKDISINTQGNINADYIQTGALSLNDIFSFPEETEFKLNDDIVRVKNGILERVNPTYSLWLSTGITKELLNAKVELLNKPKDTIEFHDWKLEKKPKEDIKYIFTRYKLKPIVAVQITSAEVLKEVLKHKVISLKIIEDIHHAEKRFDAELSDNKHLYGSIGDYIIQDGWDLVVLSEELFNNRYEKV